MTWFGNERLGLASDVSASIGTIVGPVTAIALAAVYATYQFKLFRQLEPYVNVEHSIVHHKVSQSYVAIAITARIHNVSKVAVEFREAGFRIQ